MYCVGKAKEDVDRWAGELFRQKRGPREKFYFTQTEFQECGWLVKPKDLKKGRRPKSFRYGRIKSDVVEYADYYRSLMGKTPFQSTALGPGGKKTKE